MPSENHGLSIRNHLWSSYHMQKKDTLESDTLYDGIASSFDNFRSNGIYIKKVEAMANSMLDNIVDRFRNDFPKMREQDVTLMVLSIANFNAQAISLFLDIEPNLVHSRKYKLKVRILNSDSIYKDEYLSYLRKHPFYRIEVFQDL